MSTKTAKSPTTKFESKVLPFIVKEFKKLPNPKDRPRGFARATFAKIAKRFDFTLNTADQYYWKAVWEHPRELGLTKAKRKTH